MTRPSDRSPDRGSTLVDVAVTIGIMALILGVLLAAVSTFLRNEDGVSRTVGTSRDLQQAVNYFPFDVQSGPVVRSAYDTDASRASGCAGVDAAGSTNVVSFSVPDPFGGASTHVAYRLTPTGSTARLERISCRPVGSSRETVRIADGLSSPAAGSPVARVDIVGDPVRSMTLVMSRNGRPDAEVTASPRSDSSSATPLTTTTTQPTTTTTPATTPGAACPTNPFSVTRGFLAFTETSLRLANGADSYGALATGGTFSWSGSPQISFTSPNTAFSFGNYGTKSAVYVGTTIDWATSSGSLRIGNGGYITAGDFTNGRYNNGIVNPNETRLEPAAGSSTLYVLAQSVSPQQTATNAVPVQRTTNPLDVAGAFATLRTSSTAFGGLPGGCPGVVPLQLLGQNGVGAYSGSGPLWVQFTSGAVNVLNLTVAQLNAITQWNHAGGTVLPGQNGTLLVVNVTDAGAVTWNPPLGAQNYPNHVLFNFPNATSIQVNGVMWGSLLAPRAAVTTNNVQVRGNVIARSYTQNGDVLDWGRRFLGTWPW